MSTQPLNATLAGLLSHFVTDTAQRKRDYESLQQLLGRALLPTEPAQFKSSQFSFEGADLFAEAQLAAEDRAALQTLAPAQRTAAAEYKVFARETAARSTQLPDSVPLWAAGAAVERTLGPFLRADGRQFWFDFFRIEKLVALYLQGRPEPALLFKVSTGLRFIDAHLPLTIDPATTYRLTSGSVWINAQLFTVGAPAGQFTGLTIQGGTVTLSAAPQLLNGKLTIAPNVTAKVNLELRQPPVTDADAASPYGLDARSATVHLPNQLALQFSGTNSALTTAGRASWQVYGHEADFRWEQQQSVVYDNVLHRILIPYACSTPEFSVNACQSPFYTLSGSARIDRSAWALSTAALDILNPTAAAGIGALVVHCKPGLTAAWTGLQGGELALQQPYLMAEPGRIAITDLLAANRFCTQQFNLWKDAQNPYGTSIQMLYPAATPFFYNTFANGNEVLAVLGHADVQIDRPVTAAGEALAIRARNSLLLLAANKVGQWVSLYDDNILFDNLALNLAVLSAPKPIALALRNALFKVTPVNGCVLFGELADDFVKVRRGFLFLTFGMYAYLPSLPDPYAANLGALRAQFRGQGSVLRDAALAPGQSIWQWLVSQIKWEPASEEIDQVAVSFHFAPLQNQFQPPAPPVDASATEAALAQATPDVLHSFFAFSAGASAGPVATDGPANSNNPFFKASSVVQRPLDYDAIWEGDTQRFQQDTFALLDVSTNADLLGVSFGLFGDRRLALLQTFAVAPANNPGGTEFPLQVQGMDVISRGLNVRAFTTPQISWEPVVNLSEKRLDLDPPAGANYYENDGGPTRLASLSVQFVPLAPLPLTKFILDQYNKQNIPAWSLFTLPFGLRAWSLLAKQTPAAKSPKLQLNAPKFAGGLTGGAQITMGAGQVDEPGESNRFTLGYTVQTCNVLDLNGQKTVLTQDGTMVGFSTLGQSVTEIFNNEFLLDPQKQNKFRGVPLTRIDLAGYGASIFSHWLNPNAVVAKTSQAKFDVWRGRTAHEVIQVRSLLYPWGIRVVRTITLFRATTGYVYRIDSGWRAESDGNFDFAYKVYVKNKTTKVVTVEDRPSKFEIHPGVIKRLLNVQEIKETDTIQPFATYWKKTDADTYVDVNGYEINVSDITDAKEKQNVTNPAAPNVMLQPVYFNADVLVENAVQGARGQSEEIVSGQAYKFGRVPAKGILGFVQIAPSGEPIPAAALQQLINYQLGTIGGPFDCIVNVGESGQRMRLNRFDVSNATAANNVDPVFVAAGRGSVLLPKDGSWALVKHQQGTGEVTPVPENLSVPLIRIGKLIKLGDQVVPSQNPANELLRIANPTEILRAAQSDTLNYGFLQSTDTQKALLLTPSFRQGVSKVLSKTPPLFADAFRIVNSKGIFPNIGDAVGNFGDAISLVNKGTEFVKNAALDGGKQVFELMRIDQIAAGVQEEGYKLLKQVAEFDLPSTEWKLIELGGAFKIYIEYKADKIQTPGGGTKNAVGGLNFDVDSFANDVAERWKSRMGNVGLVVDLGPIKRLMTIKGNWDAKNGAEAQYGGSDTDPDFPSPQIEFAPELQPVIEILQILQDLQGENYKGAFQRGLKLAMSNKAGTWEYKFEAAKEIPVIRFPMPDFLYNDPNAPLKLEAGLKLGAYFNAALKVPTDANQLLPTAGGYLGFYGRLSVMCVSLSIATVYAVGQANLDIGADTKTGPFLRMKFGFGAQLVVGLPVVGNVSVLYMVGVEIYADSTKLNVSAFLLFQGHAELLAGLVSVTITIEAKGTVSRANDRTDLAAQVTFGLDISIFLVIDISFSTSWQEQRQIA
ncbi:MAG: hypothetical protein HYR56_32070 [Acidobacteria bacterium]|nr:hypothetical protein [Acidobacteriota bacterium]MBI3426200.1 hypothetical protein [Acidobacteriota bacterium]